MLEINCTGNVGTARFYTKDETQVLSISLATNRKVRDTTYTDWLTAKVWGARAQGLRDHILPGQRLFIRGRAATNAYSKADGSPAAELVCHVTELEFLGPKPKTGTEPPPAPRSKRSRKPAEATAN